MELHKDLKIFCNFRRLKDIKRCNNFPVINREDVAQHSYYVTLLCMAIADDYNKSVAEYNMSFHPYDVENQLTTVKIEPLLRKALTHDLDESFTSDIPWNIKHASPETSSAIKEAIQVKMNKIYEDSGSVENMNYHCKTCKEDFEGCFVDILDMLELAQYCFEEVAMGNYSLWTLLRRATKLVRHNQLFEPLYTHSRLFSTLYDMVTCDEEDIKEYMKSIVDLG